MLQMHNVGRITYVFNTTARTDGRRLIATFRKAKLHFNGKTIAWECVENKINGTITMTGTVKSHTVTSEIYDGLVFMYTRLGESVTCVHPTITLRTCTIQPALPHTIKPKKTVTVIKPKKQIEVTNQTDTKTLNITDFIEGPIDPNIPLSRQYAYIKAWRAMKKAEKLKA